MAAAQQDSSASLPIRDFVDLWCERGILGLILSILVFGPLALGAVRGSEFASIEVCTAAVLSLWVVRFWTQRRFRLFWPPICWAVLGFVLYALVRCQTAELEYLARHELNRVLVYASLFFAVINNLNRRESATIVAVVLVALALGLAVMSVYQFATHAQNIWQFEKPFVYVSRGSGTYINPNHLAGFLEMILPLALAYTLMSRFPHWAKVLLGYSSLIILAGIVATVSRGGIIAVIITVMAFTLCLFFQRAYWLRAVLMMAVLLSLAIGFVTQAGKSQVRFARMFVSGKMEDDRFRYWDAAKQIYLENPIWGAGPGHFDQRFWAHHAPDVQSRARYVHNDWLNMATDWGTVGVGIVVLACVLFYMGVFRIWPFVQRSNNELGSGQSNKAGFILGGALGVLAIQLHSFLDFNMQIPANAILAVTILALVSAQLRFATESYWVNPGILGRVLLTVILILNLGWLGRQAACSWVEAQQLRIAAAEKPLSEEVASALKKALEIEPTNFETAFKLGELYRMRSWNSMKEDKASAVEAMKWFRLAMCLNRYDPFSPLRYGMCLDWIGRTGEATHYFQLARRLDPNSSAVAAYEGWHYIQLEDYATARKCLEYSLSLYWNQFAADYLRVVNEKLERGNRRLLD